MQLCITGPRGWLRYLFDIVTKSRVEHGQCLFGRFKAIPVSSIGLKMALHVSHTHGTHLQMRSGFSLIFDCFCDSMKKAIATTRIGNFHKAIWWPHTGPLARGTFGAPRAFGSTVSLLMFGQTFAFNTHCSFWRIRHTATIGLVTFEGGDTFLRQCCATFAQFVSGNKPDLRDCDHRPIISLCFNHALLVCKSSTERPTIAVAPAKLFSDINLLKPKTFKQLFHVLIAIFTWHINSLPFSTAFDARLSIRSRGKAANSKLAYTPGNTKL